MSQAKLMQLQFQRSSGLIIQCHFDFQFFRLGGLPGGFYFASLGVLNVHVVDTDSAGRLQVEDVFAANNQGALLCGGDAPMSGTGGTQAKIWAVKWLEAPKTTQCAGEFGIERCCLHRVSIDHKAATCGVCPGGKIEHASAFALHVKYKVVRNVR